MKRCLIIFSIVLCAGAACLAQSTTSCPAGLVCYSPDQNAQILKAINEAIASKDVIAKMLTERGASDAALQSANQLIEGYKNLDVVNGQINAKQKDVMALYEQTIKMYADLVDKLTAKINAPKSAWQKFLTAAKEVMYLASGILIGRAIP